MARTRQNSIAATRRRAKKRVCGKASRKQALSSSAACSNAGSDDSSEASNSGLSDEDDESSDLGDEEDSVKMCEQCTAQLIEGDFKEGDLAIPDGAMEEVLDEKTVRFTIRVEGATAASKLALQHPEVRKMLESVVEDAKELLAVNRLEYDGECDESVRIPVTPSTAILVGAVAEFGGEVAAKRLPLVG